MGNERVIIRSRRILLHAGERLAIVEVSSISKAFVKAKRASLVTEPPRNARFGSNSFPRLSYSNSSYIGPSSLPREAKRIKKESQSHTQIWRLAIGLTGHGGGEEQGRKEGWTEIPRGFQRPARKNKWTGAVRSFSRSSSRRVRPVDF